MIDMPIMTIVVGVFLVFAVVAIVAANRSGK